MLLGAAFRNLEHSKFEVTFTNASRNVGYTACIVTRKLKEDKTGDKKLRVFLVRFSRKQILRHLWCVQGYHKPLRSIPVKEKRRRKAWVGEVELEFKINTGILKV